jgi:DNA-binding MarR family transcriptional regulator
MTENRVLASQLSLAVVRLTRQLRSRRASNQISMSQMSVLATLATEGPMTAGALAARERVQPPSMTRVIASLSQAGLVSRQHDPSDGRQVIVALREEGRRALADESHIRELWMEEQLSRLAPAQLRVLREAVRIMGALANDDARQAYRSGRVHRAAVNRLRA